MLHKAVRSAYPQRRLLCTYRTVKVNTAPPAIYYTCTAVVEAAAEMNHHIGENQRLLPRGRTPTGGATPTGSKANALSARRSFLCGPLLPLLVAVGLFAVSMGAWRYAPLRSGGSPAPAGDAALAEHQGLGVDIPTSVDYPEVETRTELCATSSKPMLGGVDLVSYRDLEEGGMPIYGVPEHAVVHSGYTFLFSDEINKARFEVRASPGWRGNRCDAVFHFFVSLARVFVPEVVAAFAGARTQAVEGAARGFGMSMLCLQPRLG